MSRAAGALKTLVRHEGRVMRREPVFWWATGLLVLAAVYALAGGVAWHDARMAEKAATDAQSTEGLAAQQAAAGTGAFTGLVGGAKAFIALPPGPLAALSSGLADLYPERAEISSW